MKLAPAPFNMYVCINGEDNGPLNVQGESSFWSKHLVTEGYDILVISQKQDNIGAGRHRGCLLAYASGGTLGDDEEEVINTVIKIFGEIDQWQLTDVIHAICKEWTDVTQFESASIPIENSRIEEAIADENNIEEFQEIINGMDDSNMEAEGYGSGRGFKNKARDQDSRY